MKPITFLLLALAICFTPATLIAQNAPEAPINYYAEFADLMHGEMDAKPDPVATPHVSKFPAFIHYREVMNGRAEDFLAHYKTIITQSVPAADAVFANWACGGTVLKPRPVEDCSGR